jgi:hypothetical protein
MKFRSLLLISLLVGFCGMGHASWLPINSPISEQVPAVSVQSEGTAGWQMNIVIPGFTLESFSENGRTYERLSLPDEMMASDEGEAELPVICRFVALRFQGDPELEVVSEEWTELDGTYDLAPNMEEQEGRVLAPEYATRDEYLPAASFDVTPRQIMGGVSLAVIGVHPAKYNPAQKKIRVLKSAEIRIHERGPAVNYERPITETTASILRAVVPNWDEVSMNMEIVRGTLLYIVANNTTVQNAIQGLVTWRTRRGYTVEIAGPDEIGSFSTTTVKNYIQGRYYDADPPLEFVCLVGDANGSFTIPTYSNGAGVGDFNYTRLDGTDLLSDVAMGRLCFSSIGELDVILNKTFYYEREPDTALVPSHNPNWYRGAGLCAGSGSGISPVTTMRWVRERLLENDFVSSSIDTLYFTHESVNATAINAQLNAGVALWCYRGWLGVSGYDPSQVSGLHNDRRLPFMTIITCGTNDFDGTDVCETFLKTGSINQQKGCIGVLGMSSSSTHTRFNNIIIGGAIQGLMREGIYNSGGILNRARLELYRNYPSDSMYVYDFCHYVTLIGDPAVSVFNRTPDTLYVDNPASSPIGTNTLTLTVTNEHSQAVSDAYVCLATAAGILKGDWTDANGQVTFNFLATSAESLFVTATKHNCRPAINYTLITTSTRFVSPASSTFVLDDDNSGQSSGNGDGLANPGETIELAVPLKNWGTQTANGVSAVLSTTDPFIASIGNDYENYGNIPAGSTVSPPGDFVFTVASYAPEAHIVQFTLTVTDNVPNTWISAIPITMSNGKLEYFRYNVYDGGNGILDPGESAQITLRMNNIGTHSTPAGLAGYLHTTDPALVITDSVGTFTASNPGGDCNNESNPFGVIATIYTLPGERAPATVIFPLMDGFTDTISFTFNIASTSSTTPCPPDSYGYWAFDNIDVDYAKHPDYTWVEIDDRYGGYGTNLNITDNADEADRTAVVNLPFIFNYYGHSYTQICICTNGWLAMGGNQAVHTDFRNYTIPAALGPSAMIAPFWDDLRVLNTSSGGRIYTYYDVPNHRFIVEWSRVYKYNGGSNPTETFEAILYQPGYPTTPTGDGEILFQYMTCTNTYDTYQSNDYATAGIENLSQTDGVLYNYYNIPAPGATTLTSGRAILFTTQKVPVATPKAPTDLTVASASGDIQLRWNAVREDILDQPITVSQYNIYRDAAPDFTPGGGNYLGTAADTTYLDVGAASGDKYFYIVQAYGAFASESGTGGDTRANQATGFQRDSKRERD